MTNRVEQREREREREKRESICVWNIEQTRKKGNMYQKKSEEEKKMRVQFFFVQNTKVS